MKNLQKHAVLIDGNDFGTHENFYEATEQAYWFRRAGWKRVIVKPVKTTKP